MKVRNEQMTAKEYREYIKSKSNNSGNIKKNIGENRKIVNAQKVVYNGIKFRSKLECYFYQQLKQINIPFVHEKKFVIVEGFHYKGKKIRDITWTPDFIIDSANLIVDTKGIANDVFPYKLKLFKKFLVDNNLKQYNFTFPRNRKQCNDVIVKILAIV